MAPACPSCSRTVRLSHRAGEERCCRRCYDQDQLQACSRCRQPAMVASRTAAGEPVCAGCFRQDPANHSQCANCGRTALTVRRDDGSDWCRRCYRAPLATCSACGHEKPCHLASAGTPRCEHCSRLLRHAPCGRCGHDRAVWTRTADGQPLCGSCSRPAYSLFSVRQHPNRRRAAPRRTGLRDLLPQAPGLVPALHRMRDHRTALPPRALHPLRQPPAPPQPAGRRPRRTPSARRSRSATSSPPATRPGSWSG